MKKIIAHWLAFFILFFAVVAISYAMNLAPEYVIITLLVLYFGFQAVSVWNGFRFGKEWIISSIFIQTLFAVFSPLYYSNFGDPVTEYIGGTWLDSSDSLDPCHLCWWARIMMFSLLPLSVVYFISRARALLWYMYLVTIPGMLLEAFHYILQKPGIIGRESIPNPFGCTAANPCEALHVDYMGIITIPLLCFTAFAVIHILTGILLFSKKNKNA